MSHRFKTLLKAAVTGSAAGLSIGLAGAADLAGGGTTRWQSVFLWLLVSSGVLLGVLTAVVLERIQGNNDELVSKLSGQAAEILQTSTEVRKLHRMVAERRTVEEDLQRQIRLARVGFVRERLEALLRENLAMREYQHPEASSSGWRFKLQNDQTEHAIVGPISPMELLFQRVLGDTWLNARTSRGERVQSEVSDAGYIVLEYAGEPHVASGTILRPILQLRVPSEGHDVLTTRNYARALLRDCIDERVSHELGNFIHETSTRRAP